MDGNSNFDLIRESAREAVTLLKAMSNENRLLILCQLVKGERCVGDLERAVGLSQSALSQHLARLRHDGIVQARRNAQNIFYSLEGDAPERVISLLFDLYCAKAEQGCAVDGNMAQESIKDPVS